jgi:hypothetical protein
VSCFLDSKESDDEEMIRAGDLGFLEVVGTGFSLYLF